MYLLSATHTIDIGSLNTSIDTSAYEYLVFRTSRLFGYASSS